MIYLHFLTTTAHKGAFEVSAKSWAVSAFASVSMQQEQNRRPKQLWWSGPNTGTACSSGGLLELLLVVQRCPKDSPGLAPLCPQEGLESTWSWKESFWSHFPLKESSFSPLKLLWKQNQCALRDDDQRIHFKTMLLPITKMLV